MILTVIISYQFMSFADDDWHMGAVPSELIWSSEDPPSLGLWSSVWGAKNLDEAWRSKGYLNLPRKKNQRNVTFIWRKIIWNKTKALSISMYMYWICCFIHQNMWKTKGGLKLPDPGSSSSAAPLLLTLVPLSAPTKEEHCCFFEKMKCFRYSRLY